MAREINRLTAREVKALTKPGRHADGGGLYLMIDPGGAKRWRFLYTFASRRREMGLGSVVSVPLARARELAVEARASIKAGNDPIDARSRPTKAVPQSTFGDVADAYMEAHADAWRNEAHRGQWRQTLEVQAARLWSMPVADIGIDDVLAVLRPMWSVKAETARRIRGRIERVLDAARVRNLRTGENPARWRGHLDHLLPPAKKLQRGHHAAMPYADLPAFYAELRATTAPAALAMRFLILTAARSGEVRGMLLSEFDQAAAVWVVPAERMKTKRPHRVPLSDEAAALVRTDRGPLAFPSAAGEMLSDMAFAMLLRRMKRRVTTHGFRSSFRDWVDAETDFAGDLAEVALSHQVGDATERAYRRGDALAKRRHLMDAWAGFVTGIGAAP